MQTYRIKSKYAEGALFLSDIEISPLIIFCNTLFPGTEFKYSHTIEERHWLYYFPLGEDNEQRGLSVVIDSNLINFTVEENCDMRPFEWYWHTKLKYHHLLQYRVFKAYELLESMGLIEHHIVDSILKRSSVLQIGITS